MVQETLIMLCVTHPGFFSPKNWGDGLKIGRKEGFLNLKKNLDSNFY